ncbi:MAG: ATP-binding cassette domain-containing protein [Legionellaceae bacterium]|nr:ATP-binding cassette domain-containing protein [Legionellaceae bacterium]
MIEFVNVNKKFASVSALRNIHLFIQEGEIFGVIGKSGAGKSTLLRSINLLERPDTGAISIDQQNILELDTRALRQTRHKMAMIFQHFNLMQNQTVTENITLPMRIQGMSPERITAKLTELLALVELSDKANAYPSELSGGQKQRVAIARALSTEPKILLCDEATSALDPATTESILALLKKINQLYGITMVLITHEMDVIKRICHRLAVMQNGEIIEVTGLSSLFDRQKSIARELIFSQLSPQLPPSLAATLSAEKNHKPLLKLRFQGAKATTPFISQCSRELQLDINILLANIDRFDHLTCGVLIVELHADAAVLAQFIERCQAQQLSVELLGYVHDALF